MNIARVYDHIFGGTGILIIMGIGISLCWEFLKGSGLRFTVFYKSVSLAYATPSSLS
jgi:hypothetical protein